MVRRDAEGAPGCLQARIHGPPGRPYSSGPHPADNAGGSETGYRATCGIEGWRSPRVGTVPSMVKASEQPLSRPGHPEVGVRLGEVVHEAVPVLLRGDEASLVLRGALDAPAEVEVVLRWASGETTELAADIRALDGEGRVAHMDVRGVSGDWAPFLAYLGRGVR